MQAKGVCEMEKHEHIIKRTSKGEDECRQREYVRWRNTNSSILTHSLTQSPLPIEEKTRKKKRKKEKNEKKEEDNKSAQGRGVLSEDPSSRVCCFLVRF